MSEALDDYDQSPLLPAEKLREEIDSQTGAPPGGDPIIGNMWEGFLVELPNEPGLQAIFDDFQTARDGGSVSKRAGLLRTIFMADVLRTDRPYREAIPQTVPQWREYFRGLSRDYQELDDSNPTNRERHDAQYARIGDLNYNILDKSKQVQTNIASRYVSAELVMQAEPKFRDGVRWLDVGCGVQEGQHALALKDRYPIGPVHVEGEMSYVDRRRLQVKINELLARPSLIESGLGLDIFDPKERNSAIWSRASLRIASELLDETYMARHDALAAAVLPHIESRQVDITDRDEVTELLDTRADFEPNLVTLYTYPHQLELPERRRSQNNIRRLAAPDATLLLQDFAYIDGRSTRPDFLRYYKNWHDVPYKYSMFQRDLDSDQDYWRHQLSFNESHGNILKLSAEMIRRVLSA